MRRIILIVLISFLSNFVWSQIVFNRIVGDTITHITCSVIEIDTGYIFSSGTRDEAMVRCFALTYIDSEGNKQWKRTYSDLTNEYWEGYANNLKINEKSTSLMGSFYNTIEAKRGVHFTVFDSLFNIEIQKILNYDTVWKKCYNHIMFDEQSYFLIGQIHDNSDELTKALLIKTDSIGDVIWTKTYGQKYELGAQIIKTSDSNVLIGGLTFSFPTTITDEDWYLIKLDTAGSVIWEKGFGRGGFLNYDAAVAGLVESSDSNYIACGGYPAWRSSTDTYWDGCIRKISTEGDLIWEKFYRMYTYYRSDGKMIFYDKLTSVTNTEDSDIMVLGSSYGPYPQQRGFLMKTNSEGLIKWCRHYYAVDSASRDQYLVSMQQTNDNGFILAGYGNDYDSYGYDPAQQVWLVKTDSLGIDGLCYTESPELNIDVDMPEIVCKNDTIQTYMSIAGKSAPYTVEFSTGEFFDSIYYPPTFVPVEIGISEAHIVLGGDTLFTEQITGATLSNHEWGQCIAIPIEFYTPEHYGPYTVYITVTDAYGESKTISKTYSVHYCDDNIETENLCPIKLYPNPARDKVYLEIPDDINVEQANIYNSSGQIMKTVNIHKGLNIVEVAGFAGGNYIVKITTDEKVFSLSFDKE